MIVNPLSSLKEDFLCKDEGPEDGYLGVEIKSKNGQVTLNQPQLIKWMIELLNLQDSYPRAKPVVNRVMYRGNTHSEINRVTLFFWVWVTHFLPNRVNSKNGHYPNNLPK